MEGFKYSPLSEEQHEIRVITILPSREEPSRRPGRKISDAFQGAQSVDPNLNKGVETEALYSSADIASTEDQVHCKLEVVSLTDYTDAYAAFKGRSQNHRSWIEHVLNDRPPGAGPCRRLPAWRFSPRPDHGRDFYYCPRYRWGDFEAVSYHWRATDLDGQIYINGTPVRVSSDMEQLLKKLRALPEAAAGVKYWIDSICINQADTTERNKQVKRMTQLYNSAWGVVVWLGPEDQTSAAALDFVAAAGHKYFRVDIHKARWKLRQRVLPTQSQSIVDLIRRAYWRRVWIIQELAMNHMTAFICGDRLVSRRELRIALKICVESISALRTALIVKGSETSLAESSQEPRLYAADPFYDLAHLEQLLDASTRSLSLEAALALVSGAHTTDARDHVYGILGLLPKGIAQAIDPDYNLPIAEVFHELAAAIIKDKGLAELPVRGNRRLVHSLPSWVPDWTAPMIRSHRRELKRRKADAGIHWDWNTYTEGSKLFLQGIIIDRVAQCTTMSLTPEHVKSKMQGQILSPVSPSSLPATTPTEISDQLQRNLAKTLFLEHRKAGLQNHSDLLSLPWATQPTPLPEEQDDTHEHENDDHEDDQDQSHPGAATHGTEYLHAFDTFRKLNADFSIGHHTLRDFFPLYPPTPSSSVDATIPFKGRQFERDIQYAAISLIDRKLFTTYDGHLGLAPETIREGDLIVVTDCPFPIALRLKADETYEYIGECYLNSFMDGKAARYKKDVFDTFVVT